MKRELSPGEELRNYLLRLYPFDPNTRTAFQRMDVDLRADGDFQHLLYRSSVHAIARRLICTARYFFASYPPEVPPQHYPPKRWTQELRLHFRDYTGYPDRQADEMIEILRRCVREAERAGTAATRKKRIRKRAQAAGHFCYVCGREMDFAKSSEKRNAASVDHCWPQSLGGASQEYNLKVACRECDNSFKQDYLDGSDYHYEEMALAAVTYDQFFTGTEDEAGARRSQRRRYETAIFTRGGFKCQRCDTPAFRAGRLYVGRREQDDSWHFLNLAPFCERHRPEE